MGKLLEFIIESNAIERIYSPLRAQAEVPAYEKFLKIKRLTREDVCTLTYELAPYYESRVGQAVNTIRDRAGLNVVIAGHHPLPGGPDVPEELDSILEDIATGHVSAHDAHVAYETLHPFMDGNGRSGRAIWLHMMQRRERASSGFLHEYYYQSLNAWRELRHRNGA